MKKQYLIWDLPLRIFHWLLLVAFAGAWYTSEQGSEMIDYHMQIGYFILGLVIFRIIWGIVGTKHARFSQFYPTPSRVKQYFSNHGGNSVNSTAGHNPIGSFAVFAMLGLLLLQSASGLFIDDDVFSSGPYNGIVSKEIEKVMSFLHHNLFDALTILIGLHLLAVAYYTFKKKRNLITPMITGKKDAETVSETDGIPHSKLVLAFILAVLVGLFVYWLVVYNVPVSESYY